MSDPLEHLPPKPGGHLPPSVLDADRWRKRAEAAEAVAREAISMLEDELVKGDSEIAAGDQRVYIARQRLTHIAQGGGDG